MFLSRMLQDSNNSSWSQTHNGNATSQKKDDLLEIAVQVRRAVPSVSADLNVLVTSLDFFIIFSRAPH